MRRAIAPWSMLLAVLTLLPLWGCASTSDCRDYESEIAALDDAITQVETELDASENARKDLEDSLAAIETERNALRSERDSLRTELDAMGKELEDLRAAYESLLGDIQTSQLRDPSWEELRRFLQEDRTDALEYVPGKFDCEGFAITLRDNAFRRGFRCAFVAVGFGENAVGHALNAFKTERGTIYVDVTERDSIAYVEKGKPYGTIVLEGVKETYINCSTVSPDTFWKQPLGYAHYTGNLFAYDYYQNYSARWDFYDTSVSAYNAEVQRYNAAVRAFNQGTGSYSYAQLTAWGERLDDWSENLTALEGDLGGGRIEPLDPIVTLEAYWN